MIYRFDEKNIPALTQVGGKGRALMETAQAGFPVPDGIALSMDFFAPWLDQIDSSPEFSQAVSNPTKETCDAVKKRAAELCFDTNQSAVFQSALADLSGERFAVRSSSPEEDLQDTSFAGMYESKLGVMRENLEGEIAAVFASCFDIRVLTYKKQQNLDIGKPSMAVIVQRQIVSDVSGVGFSLNPLNNAYDEVVLNASHGLGEAIVSGIVTPDQYIYDIGAQKIIETKIASKKIILCLNSQGGIAQQPNLKSDEPTLSDNQVKALADLIKKCEGYYGVPVDTEWALEGDKLYLLQTRPITTYFPLFEELQTKPGQSKRFYIDVMMMTQGFDQPMSVLGLELWSEMLYKLKFGMLSPAADGTCPALYGREYLSTTAITKSVSKKAARKMLDAYDSNIRKIFQEIDLDAHPFEGTPGQMEGVKWKMVRGIFAMLPGVITSILFDHRRVVADYLTTCDQLIAQAKSLTKEDDFELGARAALANMSKLMGNATVIVAGMYAQMQVNRLFRGTEVAEDVVTMGMDLEGNPTSEMGHLLFALACHLEFKQILSREDFISRAENRKFSADFIKLLDEFMEKYAVRGFREIDIASKRINEDVGMLFDKLIQINTEENQLLVAAEKREAAYQRLLAVAKKQGFQEKFVRLAKKYRETFGYREHPKYVIVYITAILHNIALEIGADFVAQGRLDKAYDIFDLRSNEIARGQQDRDFDLRSAREKNLTGYQLTKHIKEFPLVIDSRGKIYKPKLEVQDGDFVGDPIASGKVIGRAKILHSPYEKPLLPGEILIAKATEPSWTPIFTNAAGVVMEIGGPLQHGGIIAREYGIPCVSGLIGIMDVIQDGDLLEVDGTNGLVRRVGEISRT